MLTWESICAKWLLTWAEYFTQMRQKLNLKKPSKYCKTKLATDRISKYYQVNYQVFISVSLITKQTNDTSDMRMEQSAWVADIYSHQPCKVQGNKFF